MVFSFKSAALWAVGLGAFALSAVPVATLAQSDLRKAARAPAPHFAEDQVLIGAIKGSWRPAADVARDGQRHPLESLTFWGLQPGMTIADLEPGGGYWTYILAPYAARTGGPLHRRGWRI